MNQDRTGAKGATSLEDLADPSPGWLDPLARRLRRARGRLLLLWLAARSATLN